MTTNNKQAKKKPYITQLQEKVTKLEEINTKQDVVIDSQTDIIYKDKQEMVDLRQANLYQEYANIALTASIFITAFMVYPNFRPLYVIVTMCCVVYLAFSVPIAKSELNKAKSDFKKLNKE